MTKDVDHYAEMSPIEGEVKYTEFDEEFGQYGIFGADSGFCYAFATYKDQAVKILKDQYGFDD